MTKAVEVTFKFTKEEKNFRLQNLNYFNDIGLPSKRSEDWKFSDLKKIVSKNFNKFNLSLKKSKKPKIDFIKDFEHNYIVVSNGELLDSNFQYEEKNKIDLKLFLNNDYSNKELETKSLFVEVEKKKYSIEIINKPLKKTNFKNI